jgi:hypothetical protein
MQGVGITFERIKFPKKKFQLHKIKFYVNICEAGQQDFGLYKVHSAQAADARGLTELICELCFG